MKVLWICAVWPEPTSSAAGLRTLQLIIACRDADHEVRVSSPCQENAFKNQLIETGTECYRFAPNDSAFDVFVSGYSPDVVFFDRFVLEEQFGWRVRQAVPEALRVLDTIDLHSVRRTREIKSLKGENPLQLNDIDLSSDDSIREIAAIFRSDLTLVVSDAEQHLLHSYYGVPKDQLALCRFFYPAPETIVPFANRSNFIFIGNFNHHPNMDSVKLLHSELWTKIKSNLKNPENVELHIYGAYPNETVQSLDSASSGLRIKGWTENAFATLSKYRVNLAYLRFGAGIKGKISDGWQVGTPSVASSVGAEGMHESFAFGGAVADDMDIFASRAALMYEEREELELARSNVTEIIKALYYEGKNKAAFLELIVKKRETMKSVRDKNFAGKMLWYQLYRSTEYFSRWIEVKNQLNRQIEGS